MATATQPLTPDDIDLSFVARVVPDLEVATVGDERIVLGGATQLVVLNPTAALILQFLDGEASLEELVDDFTDVLELDRSVVEDDVLAFVRDLGANGLLDGVELPKPELPEGFAEWEPPAPLEVGDELDDFTLPDLDGEERSLSEFRGARTLLVNWSPTCGFCVMIAEELAALEPLLAEHDVQVLLVTSGDAEANRAVHDQHGLAAPTLLRGDSGIDPFRGTGTPAAYLVAADGTLAEPMVVGANQVPVLARDLAGVDPATPYGDASGVVTADDARATDDELADDEVRGAYLPAPGAMCGPGGGGASSSTDWQGTRVYALGGYHVGLRYDDDETAEQLDRLFPGARVNDRRAPDNYSVALAGTPTTKGAGAARSLKLLVHGSTQLVRSRSGGRVLAALLQHLSADLEPADPTLLQVNATAAVRDGEALLLPPGLGHLAKQLQPRLAKLGIVTVDTPRTLLDLRTRELVVPAPVVAHDASVIDEADAVAQLGNELPWVRPGRYPIRTWFLTRSPEHRGPLTPGVAVAAAIPLLHDLDDLRAQVERVAELFTTVAPYGLWYANPNELVEQLSAAL
jgi:thiol-disulfide isomerase/thioredoxin